MNGTSDALSMRSRQRMQHRVLQRLCKILAGDYSVDVRFQQGVVPHTDGKTVVLNPQAHHDFIINRIQQESTAAHEAAGHIAYTNFKAWRDMIQSDCDPVMKDLVNIVEDARVNYLLSKKFQGSGAMLKVSQKITYNQFKDSIGKGTIGSHHISPQLIALASEVICGLQSPFIGVDGFDAIEAFMSDVRPVMKKVIAQRDTDGVIEACESILLPIYRKHYPRSANQDMAEAMARQSQENPFTDDDHSDDTIDERAKGKQVGKEKVDESEFDEFEMPEPEQEDESIGAESSESDDEVQGEGESDEGESDEGESSEGESSEGESSEGESSAQGSESESESDDEIESESDEGESDGKCVSDEVRESLRKAGLDEDMIEQMGDVIDELVENIEQEIHEEAVISDKESRELVNDIEWSDRIVQNSLEYNQRVIGHRGEAAKNSFDSNVRKNKSVITTLQSRLGRWVEANKQGKVSRRHKIGILDERRIVFSDDSESIYKRRKNPKKSRVAVSIIIDHSSSMGNNGRHHHAAEFAVVLAEICNGLGWDFEILGFDNCVRMLKGFGDALNGITKENICTPCQRGMTAAGEAVQASSARQVRMGYDKRIGICVMDGGPNGSVNLKTAVEESPIEWLGIGIDGMDVSRFFNNAISCNASGLIQQLPAIKAFVKKAL